jgi:hypothetical protein
MWSTIDRPDWIDLISFSYMLPPVETNYDLVMQNNVTPSAKTTYNLGQKDLRYLNVWSDLVACSNVAFHSGENFIGVFDGSYDSLRGKPKLSPPDHFETLTFFPDKSLTLTAQSNNIISGLNLEAAGPQLSWKRADRMICTEMSVLNGPISQVGLCELVIKLPTKFTSTTSSSLTTQRSERICNLNLYTPASPISIRRISGCSPSSGIYRNHPFRTHSPSSVTT